MASAWMSHDPVTWHMYAWPVPGWVMTHLTGICMHDQCLDELWPSYLTYVCMASAWMSYDPLNWHMYAWPVPGWVVQGGQLSIEAFCITMPSVSPTHAYISWQCGIYHSRVGPNRSGTHGLDHMLIVKTGWDILVICRYITWDGRHVIYW